jgi:hypothetical protein
MMRPNVVGTILFILFGPIVWAAQLGVSYAAHAALCAAGDRLPLGAPALPWVLGAAMVVAVLLIAVAMLSPNLVRVPVGAVRRGEDAAFATAVMRTLGLLSLLGVGYFGLTMLLLPLCLPLR